MAVDWKNVRIPKDLHRRINALAAEMDYAASMGWTVHAGPLDGVDRDQVPIWWVIDRAITEFEKHRGRSRRAKVRKEAGAKSRETPPATQ